MLTLFKQLNDGRYMFCKDGMYFSLTKEQIEKLNKLVEESN